MGTLRFPWPCLARRGGTRSLENEQARATLDGQNTCYGVRSGPKYSPWCTGEAPECPATGSARKRPAAGGEKLANVQRKKKKTTKAGTQFSLLYSSYHVYCDCYDDLAAHFVGQQVRGESSKLLVQSRVLPSCCCKGYHWS